LTATREEIAEIFAHGMLERGELDDEHLARSRPRIAQAVPGE